MRFQEALGSIRPMTVLGYIRPASFDTGTCTLQKLPTKVGNRAWWCTPLIPALGRQRQVDFWVLGQPGLQSKFQNSQGYTEKPCLEKTKNKQTNKKVRRWLNGCNCTFQGNKHQNNSHRCTAHIMGFHIKGHKSSLNNSSILKLPERYSTSKHIFKIKYLEYVTQSLIELSISLDNVE